MCAKKWKNENAKIGNTMEPRRKKLKEIQEKKKEVMVQIRMSVPEYDRAMILAKRYAEGNLSAWIRFAATKTEPQAKDLI